MGVQVHVDDKWWLPVHDFAVHTIIKWQLLVQNINPRWTIHDRAVTAARCVHEYPQLEVVLMLLLNNNVHKLLLLNAYMFTCGP